jgi:multidrug resistance efflux pump
MKAMELKHDMRHQRVKEFMDDLLGSPVSASKPSTKWKGIMNLVILVIVILIGIGIWQKISETPNSDNVIVEKELSEKAKVKAYDDHISKGDVLAAKGEDSYKQAMAEYEEAIKINEQYNLGITSASTKKAALSEKIDGLVADYKYRADQFIELLGAAGGRQDAIALLEKAQKLKQDNVVEYKLNKLKQEL